MANDFDKNKQPVEWLLEEIKNSVTPSEPISLSTVESTLELIRETMPQREKATSIKWFQDPWYLKWYIDTLPIGTALNVHTMRWDTGGKPSNLKIIQYSGASATVWIKSYPNTEFILTHPTLAVVQQKVTQIIEIKDFKVTREGMYQPFLFNDLIGNPPNYGAIYLECYLE